MMLKITLQTKEFVLMPKFTFSKIQNSCFDVEKVFQRKQILFFRNSSY